MLWTGRPGDALQETRRALALFQAPDLTILSGRLLMAGMRACADLAGQARARHDGPAVTAAVAAAADAADAADGLATWVEQMGRVPFTDHPTVATIPAERATWDAERTRVAGPGDPGAWDGAAKAWQDLSCPHRAGYRGGGRRRRSWTPGSQPPRRPARCAPPRPPPTGTAPCWPRSAPWPSGPGSRCTRRPPANPKPGPRPSCSPATG